LGAAYAPEQRHALSIDRLFQPESVLLRRPFWKAKPLVAAEWRWLDYYAEVKRMYAREPARGRGIGKALLASLEAEARNAGRSLLRLETCIHQTAAIALYERWGLPATRTLRPLRRAAA